MNNAIKTFKRTRLAITLSILLFAISYAQEDAFKKHLVYQEQTMNSINPTKIVYRGTLQADI